MWKRIPVMACQRMGAHGSPQATWAGSRRSENKCQQTQLPWRGGEGILTQHGKSWQNYSQTSNKILMEPSHPWWEEHWLINVFLQPRVLPPLSAATTAVVGGLQQGKASLLTQPRGWAEQGSL